MSAPALNAILNSFSALLLVAGYFFIRRGRTDLHRMCMVSAFITSCIFLISYVLYHWHAGHVRYTGQGWMRTVYLSILASHTLLAMVIVPLILRTLYLAWKCRWEAHKRLARWTLPIWFYVSVTGVVIYEMLY